MLAVAAALAASACSTPSARYGLAPPATDRTDYPNINATQQLPKDKPMSAAERAAAQAAVEREAGVTRQPAQ